MSAAAKTAGGPLRYARRMEVEIAMHSPAAMVDIGRAAAFGVGARRTAHLVAPVLSAYCDLFPGRDQVGMLEDTMTQLAGKRCQGRRCRLSRPWGGTAGLESGFFGEPLEWTVPYLAKPYMTVLETWEESDRGESKLTYFE